MRFTTIILGFSAIVFSGVLASPIDIASPVERSCVWPSCNDCYEYCFNDFPCPVGHNCGIAQTGCILQCGSTGCCPQ